MQTKLETRLGPGGSRGAEQNEDEKMVIAWRAYVARPEAEADQLLRAIDPIVQKAVAHWAKRKLNPSLWDDVAQELRLHLVCRKFLLGGRKLRGIRLRQEFTGPPSPNETKRRAALARALRNRIYMAALWQVADFVRDVVRYEKMRASFARETNGEIHWDKLGADPSLKHKLRHLRTCLRRRRYNERERALLLRHLRGEINQRKLGQGLGLGQSATSKRVAELKRDCAFLELVAAAKQSHVGERDL